MLALPRWVASASRPEPTSAIASACSKPRTARLPNTPDVINPGSLILSGVMMLDYIGWKEAGKTIIAAFEKTIAQKRVTYDFERQMPGATKLKTSEFAAAVIENMTP